MVDNNSIETNWIRYLPQIRSLFNQINDSLFIVDHQGRIILLNQSACTLTGYTSKELTGTPIGVLMLGHPDTEKFKDPQRSIHQFESGQPKSAAKVPILAEIHTKSGKNIPIEITHLHFPELVENISCIIARNLSERRIAKTLQETNIALSSSLKLTEVFDILLVELRKLIPYDGANIMLVNENNTHIERAFGYESVGEKTLERINSFHFDHKSAKNIRFIIEKQRVLIIRNTQKAPYWIHNEVSVLYKSWIGAPIIIDGRVDAIISLDKIEPDFFTKEHIAILSILTNQAGSAIKNARLYEVETRRIQQLDGLQSTLAAINSKLELKTLLHEIVVRSIKLLNASNGELALYDSESEKLKVVVSYNFKEDYTGQFLEIGTGLLGTVASTKKPYKVDRFSDENEKFSNLKFHGAHSGLAVPLIVDKELLGVLGIADLKSNRIFSDIDVSLLNTFAQQATIAINNSRLFEDAKQKAEEATTLRKASAVVTSTLDQSKGINLILEQLAQVIPCDTAVVMLQKKDYLRVVGSYGKINFDQIVERKIKLSENIPPVNVFLKRTPILVRDASTAYRQFIGQQASVVENNSWLGAPLVIHDRPIGILSLSSDKSNHFTQEHMRLITAFADQVAIALENARLYTETRRSVDRLQTLHRLSQAINSNLRTADIYPAIYQAVSEVMTTEFFSISLYNAKTRVVQDVFMIDNGKPQQLSSRPLGKGLYSKVIKEGKSFLFSQFDSQQLKETEAILVGDLEKPQISQSILMVPLIIGSTRIGVISAQSYQPNMYTDSDREMLELLSANVAIAIENARLFDEVQQLAITDPLTKLYNRRKFEELSIKEFNRSRRYQHPLCLFMIDLDQFKSVNDIYGHIVGDQVLSGLASLCRNNLRNVDVLARFGGEEFIVLLPETESSQAMTIAERLREECAQTEFSTNQGVISLTISLGVAELDNTCKNLDEFINRADQALYTSKNTGRNTVTLWTSELVQ